MYYNWEKSISRSYIRLKRNEIQIPFLLPDPIPKKRMNFAQSSQDGFPFIYKITLKNVWTFQDSIFCLAILV